MSSFSKKHKPFPNLNSYYKPFNNMNELSNNQFKEDTSNFKINDSFEMVAVAQTKEKKSGYYPNFLIKNINDITEIKNQNNLLLTCYFLPLLSVFTNIYKLFPDNSLTKQNNKITLNTQSTFSFDNFDNFLQKEEYKQLFYIYSDKTISQNNYNKLSNSNKKPYKIDTQTILQKSRTTISKIEKKQILY